MYFLKYKFILMSTSNISRWNEVYDPAQLSKTKLKSRVCLEELVSATCSCAIYSMFLRSLFPVSLQLDETSWILLPVWCGHMIWSMGGVSVSEREKDSQRCRQEAGSSDSGLVDVTLTENREGHVGVSREPDTPTSPAPPPSPSATICL